MNTHLFLSTPFRTLCTQLYRQLRGSPLRPCTLMTPVRVVLPLLVFLVLSSPISALELKAYDPLTQLEWTFETTRGFQNLRNIVMSKEGGTQTSTSEALMFAGILFHSDLQSYMHTRSFLKCALNLGFRELPHLFWSESAYELEKEEFNELVRSMEFDAQFLLPFLITHWITLHPFVGYSFIDYTYEDDGRPVSQNRFNTLVIGMHYEVRLFRWLKTNIFVSYSPLLFANYENDFLRYLYYGGELISDTHPLAFTFLVSFRKAFRRNRYYFDYERYNDNIAFNFVEIGMSVHVNL